MLGESMNEFFLQAALLILVIAAVTLIAVKLR